MAVPACCINKASGTGPPRHDETGPLALWRHSYPSPPAETIRFNLRSSAHPGPAVNPSPSPGRPARSPSGLRRAAGVRSAAGCPMTRLVFSATFSAGDLFARGNPSSRRGKSAFASKGPAVSARPRGLAGGLSRYAHECWIVAAAVTGQAGPSGQRMPRRRRVRWLPDDRLGGRIAGRGVQVAKTAAVVGASPVRETPHRGGVLGDSIGSDVHPPLSVKWLGKDEREIGLPKTGHAFIVLADRYPSRR
jgi:hypothetical protein